VFVTVKILLQSKILDNVKEFLVHIRPDGNKHASLLGQSRQLLPKINTTGACTIKNFMVAILAVS
jgi:hypothetical protein